jgi:alpha-L-fucosidase
MSEYGKMDILWLDGGWVRPLSTVDTSVEWQRGIKQDQDIDMAKIAAMARGYQPGMLVVDRSVTGEYENYTTPEQQVPQKPLDFPWETCMTMGGSWSYVPGDHYKSAEELIHLLIKIVSRGGNFLLNIGPGPDGEWDPEAYKRLTAIGDWMKGNDKGIYESRPLAPYSSDNIYFTQHKSGKSWFAYYLTDTIHRALPAEIALKNLVVPKGSKISLPVVNSNLKWKVINGTTIITIPNATIQKIDTRYAILFKVELP